MSNLKEKPKDRLQEIANQYGVIVYVTDPDRKGCQKIITCGMVAHGFDCDRPRQAGEAVVAHLKGYC